ncbi:PREDICTED: surfeit locus protein 2-like isoform X2 [Lupinus angustifolius]|nr:PREDICTED: surfeit locus protein 2-like isoform X2 [Lupinus angustifolius]
MATGEENEGKKKEGSNLLGSPTFKELENGRFKCVETGHELPSKEIESYSNSKKCRLGLIDFAVSNNKPPLNMFKQDPLSRSKLICKLTRDSVNKSEEHIWKHMIGKRFLNKLDEEEEGKLSSHGMEIEESLEEPQSTGGWKKDKKKKKKKKNKGKNDEEIISEVRKSSNEDSDTEEEDFWIPAVGERWDHDDGEDRWHSDSESEEKTKEDVIDAVADEDCKESEELSSRTKRMSIEIGPSSFASRKKKSKKNNQSPV